MAALHVHRHACRRDVQRATWKEKVFPGTALENNVYDGQESTRWLKNMWAGEALIGCPGLPLPCTHLTITPPRASTAPIPTAQGSGLFRANPGKKGRVQKGSWRSVWVSLCGHQRLWHLLVKCTDVPAEAHSWALRPDTMQTWAALFVQLSHSQQRMANPLRFVQRTSEWGREAQDKAIDHEEHGPLGPLYTPHFLGGSTTSQHTHWSPLHIRLALCQSQGESICRVLFMVSSRSGPERKTKSQPPISTPYLRDKSVLDTPTTEHLRG